MSRYIQAGPQATVAEVGFDSLEWLLKRLSALAELTHKLAKKLWALWLGLGGVAFAGHSGQAQTALLLPPQSNSLHGLSKSRLSPPCVRISSLRSTLDVYTQAISPAKHAAQAAVLDLVFASETNCTA